MNLGLILTRLFGAFIMCLVILYSGVKMLRTKLKLNIQNVLVILALIIIIAISGSLIPGILKVVLFFLTIAWCYRFLFDVSVEEATLTSFLMYLMIFLSEIIMTLIIMAFPEGLVFLEKMGYAANILSNAIVAVINFVIVLVLGNRLAKFTAYVSNKKKLVASLVWIMIIMAIEATIMKLSRNNWWSDGNFILNVVITLGLIVTGIVFLKQSIDMNKLDADYHKFIKYASNTETLLENYQKSQHEHINELLIIRSMVNKNNKRLLAYIDDLTGNKCEIEDKWLVQLKHLPFGGLKGVIHYKIAELKSSGVNVFLEISLEVGKSKLSRTIGNLNENICKIICIFLDNAKDATLLTDLKRVFINSYCTDDGVVFEIANDFINKLDLSKINDNGYSSKGKGRGYGLSIAQKIINSNNHIVHCTYIDNELFVQKLIVKI